MNLKLERLMLRTVPLTLEQIVEETRRWPAEKVGELVGRLTEELHTSSPEIEATWKADPAHGFSTILPARRLFF